MHLPKGKTCLFSILLLLVLSVLLGIFSFYPIVTTEKSTRIILDDTFTLTDRETYRQGLGSFHGNENISIIIKGNTNSPINFTLITYNGQQYNALAQEFNYSFAAGADYYDAVFVSNATLSNTITLQVLAQSPLTAYPFSWLSNPAKILFIFSWVILMLLILKPEFKNKSSATVPASLSTLSLKNRRWIQFIVIFSLIFWFLLLTVNTYPLGTFENWYTDSARNSYTASLFPKVGFSIFDTPLGHLSSGDNSFYKFVTWPEMPHLYPLGSILLFLPFGALLEAGLRSGLVLKLEIALFLIISHVCLYYYLKRFWNQGINSLLWILSIYIFYIVLVVYSANGQFDTIAFLFALIGVIALLESRYDTFLLFVAISMSFKYQAGIFLAPLVIVGLIRLFQHSKPSVILKNKAILAAFALVAFDLFTAYLSLTFFVNVRSGLVMNSINVFSPHGQISWVLQSFAVFLFVGVTVIFAVYVLDKNRLLSLFAIFLLLPCLTMPYFQPWYLPTFFLYPLIPQQKRSLEVTLIWLIVVIFILSFGGLSYNPLFILERIRSILNL